MSLFLFFQWQTVPNHRGVGINARFELLGGALRSCFEIESFLHETVPNLSCLEVGGDFNHKYIRFTVQCFERQIDFERVRCLSESKLKLSLHLLIIFAYSAYLGLHSILHIFKWRDQRLLFRFRDESEIFFHLCSNLWTWRFLYLFFFYLKLVSVSRLHHGSFAILLLGGFKLHLSFLVILQNLL